jgi:hypothetical protein
MNHALAVRRSEAQWCASSSIGDVPGVSAGDFEERQPEPNHGVSTWKSSRSGNAN